jgi:hypothetical protein
MRTTEIIDWTDVEAAAEHLAGNWQRFESFAWSRGYDLDDADKWLIWYTSHRDAGLLAQSNEQAINERLNGFAEGDAPDLVFERHSHWAVGFVDGFSLRVYGQHGTITDAFREFCRIKERLEDYPVLDEADFSDREYQATLDNYCTEMWRLRAELPDGWEAEVYHWFSDQGHERYTENCDDRGGYAPRAAIIEALKDLGLLPTSAVGD